jgi:UDP-glucose:O-linked fucose beta-1,3-glucosyltransferase
MRRTIAQLVVAFAIGVVVSGGCRSQDPAPAARTIGQLPALLAVTELPAVADRPARSATLARSAPWGRPDARAANLLFQHELPVDRGAWTLARTFPALLERMGKTQRWLLLAPPDLAIDVDALAARLDTLDPAEPLLLGRALRDRDRTPIHHYVEPTRTFPDAGCGVVLSRALVERLARAWATAPPKNQLTIDAPYELATWIEDQTGTSLTDVPALCGRAPRQSETAPVPANDVVFAVRTYSGFHGTRVPIVQSTWAAGLPRIVYYSDVADPGIPTVATGVANVTTGHCEKLAAVLRLLRRDHRDARWFVLADDDTLFDVPSLLARLGELDSDDGAPLVVGSRYGAGHNLPRGGADYPTLGAGAAVNRVALQRIVDGWIPCPSPETPDDMWLGATLKHVGIELIDEPGMHQEQPSAYTTEALSRAPAISFHHFTPRDPVAVYREFLAPDRATPR